MAVSAAHLEKDAIREQSLALMTVMDASKMAERLMDKRLAPLGLSSGQQRILALTHLASSPLTPSMLAALLLQEHHGVSGILNRLEHRGLVSRERDSLDRRVVWVGLTEQGTAMAVRSIELVLQLAREVRPILEAKPAAIGTLREIRDLGIALAGVDKRSRREALRRVWGYS